MKEIATLPFLSIFTYALFFLFLGTEHNTLAFSLTSFAFNDSLNNDKLCAIYQKEFMQRKKYFWYFFFFVVLLRYMWCSSSSNSKKKKIWTMIFYVWCSGWISARTGWLKNIFSPFTVHTRHKHTFFLLRSQLRSNNCSLSDDTSRNRVWIFWL